jgi:serine/threonine protein kinase
MQQPAHAIRCLKSDGLHNVWLIEKPGRALRTLKTWPLGPLTVIKLLLGIAQPQRQMRGMRKLRRVGVRTPQCFGSWHVKMIGMRPVVQIELEFAPGTAAADLIAPRSVHDQLGDELLVRSARLVGRAVAAMAAGGVFHRDLKPSNIVLDARNPQQPIVWVIDTVGVRAMRRRINEIERMLERLTCQPVTLEQPALRAVAIATLRAALRPLHPKDRRAVLSRLRLRAPA